MSGVPPSLVARQLNNPDCLLSPPPSIPLIISSQDNWNPLSCQIETPDKPDHDNHTFKLVPDALELLRTIDKPLAVLSICGPYRSGKSYFISRVLGSPGAFKLGHSMQACTRGIWMSTTILECQDFATIVLDTEGIDAVGVSETFAMSLLTLTTLLSSFLIYNSKKVPQKLDLDKMRCFSQLSTSLLTQCGNSVPAESRKEYFPHFLWLLRDVALKMTDREGKEIEPTEFLHTRILASKSGELTVLGQALVDLFPTLECATLPIPSIKRDVIRNITDQQDKLKPAFNAAVDDLIHKILEDLSPKKTVDGKCKVNGKLFVALAKGYVEAINQPGAVPDLNLGWQAIVRLELNEVSYQLVREYEREMETALEGNLPMEESNLLRIHRQFLNVKKSVLREEIRRIDPLHSSDGEAQPLVDNLEQSIAQWSESDEKEKVKVTGGALYEFTSNNYTASKTECQKLFENLVQNSKIRRDVQKSIRRGKFLDIEAKVKNIEETYNADAVGPAADEVLQSGLRELNQLSDIVHKIPGPPSNVRVVGRGSDQLKLKWDPPKQNPDAVEEYIVYKKTGPGEEDWEEAVRTVKTWAVVEGLKPVDEPGLKDSVKMGWTDDGSGGNVDLQVISNNSLIASAAEKATSRTLPSNIAYCLGLSASRTFFSPIYKGSTSTSDPGLSDYAKAAASYFVQHMITAPVRAALAPITIPVLALKESLSEKKEGDLNHSYCRPEYFY